ncbi:MAG: oligosaccharide flippase family protein [Actinomycetota bacterium]|nr:oligosaccharide flippase family protein [Actinomycetota bacterium]
MSLLRLALGIGAIPALTHGLGLSTYGVWAVLISILSLTSLLQFGLAPAVTFHIARLSSDHDAMRTILVTSFILFSALGVLAGLILLLCAHPIATLAFGNADRAQEAESVLPILGVAACCQFLRQWVMAAEAGLQRYDVQAWADGLGNIALYGGLVVIAALAPGLVVLAVWWGIANLGTLFVHWYLWRTRTPVAVAIKRGWDSSQARLLLNFGVRQWASQFGGSVFGYIDRIAVNMILGPLAAGIYSAGTSVAVRINELSAAPVQVVGPAIAAADGPSRSAALYRRAEALNALLAYGLAAAVMLASEPLARFLVPEQAETMASVLRIMGLSYGIYSINAVAFFAAQGVGRPAINSRWMMAAGCAFVFALVPLTRVFGTRGAAWANLAYAVTLGINLEVLGCLGLRKAPSLVMAATFLASLAVCFGVSSTVMLAIEHPLAQLILGMSTLAATGGWILLRLIGAAANSSPPARLLV